jgi:prevent-host-death family protein
MISVSIAELKNKFSAYLQHVRDGEEILIRELNLLIAKLIPLPSAAGKSVEERALVAEGRLLLPVQELDEEAFWAIGSQALVEESRSSAIRRAVSKDREKRDDSLLGR